MAIMRIPSPRFKRRTASGLLFVAVLAFTSPSFAWAPAVHGWIAIQATGNDDGRIAYGAVAADLNEAARETVRSELRQLSHNRYDLLEPSLFADGFAAHNEMWGADAYAHGATNPDTHQYIKGYIQLKSEQLSQELGISVGEGHLLMETAADFTIRKLYGPRVGGRVFLGALFSGRYPSNELADAFSQPLADATGLSVEEAESEISQAASLIRAGAGLYGSQFAMPVPYLSTMIPLGLSLVQGTDVATASLRFARAMELCEDLEDELEYVIPRVRDQLPPE
ncbi:MAG: hypothetical protein K1Y02_23345 [Candidatus Hydrogenedentes bacterium]|nr:hypothetical protein [Candidatus Hydrogenedentota bacterium]